MGKQISLSGLMDELSQVRTKKREFWEQMDQLILWGKWVEKIKPCYYKGERGNKPYGIELMLRLYVLQNLYTLSDEGDCRSDRQPGILRFLWGRFQQSGA